MLPSLPHLASRLPLDRDKLAKRTLTGIKAIGEQAHNFLRCVLQVSQNGVARIPPIRPTAVRQQSIGGVTDSGISIPMDISCPKEPLLGPSRSTSSLLNLGKYVTIHSRREDSGCQAEEDDYIATTSNGHVITKV